MSLNSLCRVGQHEWVVTASQRVEMCSRPECKAVKINGKIVERAPKIKKGSQEKCPEQTTFME